jgi:divalent metal cation (Fe/Co/Zn/Cd) transporter
MTSETQPAVRLEWLTIGWNAVEAVVALIAGFLAASIALTAFGLDSLIEVFAASVALRELAAHTLDPHEERGPLRLIGGSLFVLAAYVAVIAVHDLLVQARPERSIVGIVVAALATGVMGWLARAKHREGHRIGSLPLIADSRETRLCSLMATVTLLGLVLNGAFHWWWADPIAGLAIAALAVWEGVEAWRGSHPSHHR